MTDWKTTKLRDFFAHYDPKNPQHLEAVDLLQRHASSVMNDNADWVKTYRGSTQSSSYLKKAVRVIEEFEGFRSTAYKCPAGVWTIGYGTTYYPNGEVVHDDDPPINKTEGKRLLENHVAKAVAPTLERTVPTWGVMNDNQKAAIISFAYNLGSHFYGNSGFNTITRALSKRENWSQVPSALSLYVNPGSQFEAGLRRRRLAEAELWNGQGQFSQ